MVWRGQSHRFKLNWLTEMDLRSCSSAALKLAFRPTSADYRNWNFSIALTAKHHAPPRAQCAPTVAAIHCAFRQFSGTCCPSWLRRDYRSHFSYFFYFLWTNSLLTDQHVDEQNGHDYHEHDKQYLAFRFMIGAFHCAEVIAEIRERHQEHSNDWFHRRRHWIRFGVVNTLGRCWIVKWQEDYIISLSKSHHEHHVNRHKSNQISHHHAVDHHHERSNGLKSSTGCHEKTETIQWTIAIITIHAN